MSDTCMKHIENYWKSLTTMSNELYDRGDFEKALPGYKDALYRAEVLDNHREDCLRLTIPFVQVYSISCTNLHNIYNELGLRPEAKNMLKQIVRYLLHLFGQEGENKEELQSELKKVALMLLAFDEQTEKDDGEKQSPVLNCNQVNHSRHTWFYFGAIVTMLCVVCCAFYVKRST